MELKDGCLVELIGDFEIKSPKVPPRSEFLNGDVKVKKDQKFKRTEIPSNDTLNSWPAEKRKAFIQKEIQRRQNGVFFLNNGQVTWITGLHYYYLNYYHMDIGKPDYLDVDRRFFWMWWLVENDDKCEGLFFVTRRQSGKSYKAGCIVLEHASRSFNAHDAMQSKTDSDAKKLFKRSVVHAWRKLPGYFSPKFNNSNNPETSIRFEAATVTGKSARKVGGGTSSQIEYNSWIDYANSKENALDGEKISRFINDEILKKQDYNPFKRWDVVRRMFVQRGKVIAKALHTSTVGEEIDDTQVEAGKQFWRDCDPANRFNGKTKSGCYRLFFPAHDGSHPDEYGMSDLDAGKQEYDGLREAAGNDVRKLRSVQRAFPYTIEEALKTEGSDSLYDIAVLEDYVLSEIKAFEDLNGKSPYKTYRLEWTDKMNRSMVRAVPDEKGRFLFSWLPESADELNMVHPTGTIETLFGTQTRWSPLNKDKYTIGCDPFDRGKVTSERHASQAAGHGFRKYDPFEENKKGMPGYYPSNAFIFEYINRPQHPAIFFEDMIMACHLLGCQIHVENQKDKIMDYFENRGYKDFLASRPEFTHTKYTEMQEALGTPSTRYTIGKYVECTIDFISGTNPEDDFCLARDWRRCPFPRTVEQWINFDMNKPTKFDAAVSSGFTLMSAFRFTKPRPQMIEVQGLVNYR